LRDRRLSSSGDGIISVASLSLRELLDALCWTGKKASLSSSELSLLESEKPDCSLSK
jgi:hypothetical protein